MNILDFEIKAPSAILMIDFRWDFHVCLCVSEHVHICTHNPIPHQKQGPQTLGAASMRPMLSGLLNGTMLSVMIMAK